MVHLPEKGERQFFPSERQKNEHKKRPLMRPFHFLVFMYYRVKSISLNLGKRHSSSSITNSSLSAL